MGSGLWWSLKSGTTWVLLRTWARSVASAEGCRRVAEGGRLLAEAGRCR